MRIYIFIICPLASTNENQAYKRTVHLLEDHKVTLISIFFSWGWFFSPDDTGIRTNEKNLRLLVHTGTTTPGLYIPSGTTLLDHNPRPAQISPTLYSPAAQRSAVRSRAEPCGAVRSRAEPCSAVPCALRCGAVSCCAVCFLSNIEQYRVQYVLLGTTFLLFSFSTCIYLIFHGPLFFPPRKVPPYCRSERNTGNKSTQHSWAQQGNLLCTSSSSWHNQITVRTKSWTSSFCPLYMFLVAFFLALRERSGRRQPPAGRSPCNSYSRFE